MYYTPWITLTYTTLIGVPYLNLIHLLLRYLDAAAIRRTMGTGASEQEVEDMLGRGIVLFEGCGLRQRQCFY